MVADTSMGGRAGNLPAEVTSFVGRRRELAEARRMLSASRLVTLTGAAGVGKTRIALRLAAKVRGAFADGVWLVELSALQDAGLLAHEVSERLKPADTGTRPPVEALADYCADRSLLLVLDTCEHLVDEVAELARTLLRAGSRLHILATSRQPLNIPGEQTLVISPMRVPGSAAEAARCDAVTLFAERAAAAVPGFVLGAGNGEEVAGLCRRLEGIPLAIELAAGRLRVLSVEQMVARLDDRFMLLAGGDRAVPGRHQALRTAVGWSHELCEPGERLLWARLSVFAGGFDLEAVEVVCADERLGGEVVLGLVSGLVEKSIASREENADGVRFQLLNTLREYGAEWLRALGEQDVLLRRHRDYHLSLAERAEREWFGAEQIEWLRRLEREQPNLRAALDFCVTAGETRAGLRLAAALRFYWLYSGQAAEGRHWLRKGLALDTGPSPQRAKALCASGLLASHQGDLEAAAEFSERARDLAERLGDLGVLAQAVHRLGAVAVYGGDLAYGAALLEEALDRYKALGVAHQADAVLARIALAATANLRGDLDGAIDLCRRSLAICRGRGDRTLQAHVLSILARAEWSGGDMDGATAHAHEAVRLRRSLPDPPNLARVVELLAWIAEATGDARRAAVLLGAGHEIRRGHGLAAMLRSALYAPHYECVERTRALLGDSAHEAAFRRGTGLTLEQTIAYALGETPRLATARRRDAAPVTPREREVAELVAEGLSNRQIAGRLLVAKRTVDAHVEHILTKLGFSSRTQIAAWVTEQRITGE